MFPGILDHRVKPTEGRRVCAAMNLHKCPYKEWEGICLLYTSPSPRDRG